ncbi:hypothetical protein GGR58DRAFT_324669 [Xylaria digitata]|nr:hypothetical protein GGR58DRAFT_324669 [Xylaria digitata]
MMSLSVRLWILSVFSTDADAPLCSWRDTWRSARGHDAGLHELIPTARYDTFESLPLDWSELRVAGGRHSPGMECHCNHSILVTMSWPAGDK